VGGHLIGDAKLEIKGVSPLATAQGDQIALVMAVRYRADVPASQAGALLVAAGLEKGLDDTRPRVVVGDPHAALIPILEHLHPELPACAGVHLTAVLGCGVELGDGVEVGPYAVLGEGTKVGDRVRVGAHAVVGRGCRIGADSVLHPQVTLYPGVLVGERTIIHSGARIGADGFGYASSGEGHLKVPQVGGCIVEDDVEIGANACVDRGSIGDTVIGRGSKLDNLVHVAHNVCIGPHCVLTALVGIAGSTNVGAGVSFGGQSGVSGHLSIGDGARVGAKSAVFQDVPAGSTVVGIPASEHRPMMRAFTLFPRLPEMFRRLRALEGGSGASVGAIPPGEEEGGPG
jgi:UDP-3-O-[3-hydroxymyristoyl] glucosamine N-acyltransferase